MEETNTTIFRASHINSHGQKPSLTKITPSRITVALSHLYPHLLVLDTALDNLLWISPDIRLNFINLTLIYLASRFLLIEKITLNVEGVVLYLLGIISFYFIIISICFYINSLFQELENDEPPTVDDIIILLENITDKLATINSETYSLVGGKYFSFKKFLLTVTMLTPLQYLIIRFNYVDSTGYILMGIVVGYLYHSSWVQATARLLWRHAWVRAIYNWNWGKNQIYPIDVTEYIEYRTLTERLKNLHIADGVDILIPSRLESQFQTLLANNAQFAHLIVGKKHKFQVMEVVITERQRKWHPTGWLPKLQNFEGSVYNFQLSEKITKNCDSIEAVENNLPDAWSWLDEKWADGSWVYSDTNWVLAGMNDSPECFTRIRSKTRKIFTLIKD